MKTIKSERRRTPRQAVNRAAQIKTGNGASPHACMITDISAGGVRLQVEDFDVPDDFVLVLSGEGIARESPCRVVWRFGNEIGASFIGIARRPIAAAG